MDNHPILDRLIEQLRRVLTPYFDESDPSAYAAQYADRFTTFDPWSDGRRDDAAATAYSLASAGSIPPFRFEILNPRLDLVGDAAVFTFNIDMFDRSSGDRFAMWNATHVHNAATDSLELVHTHWSYAVPPELDPEE